jgi:N6-L-threonylcarbamoyladenine synthase
MEVIGETLDDAVGEAFDKSAKILGLPYPGGPFVDKYARLGNPNAFEFSKPKMADLNFSFSGLKTGILYFIQKKVKENPNFIEENLNDICASIQRTIVEILFDKLEKAVELTGIKHIAIAGGVSANSEIRETLKAAEEKFGWKTYIPKFEYTTDNAGMIAIVGYLKYLENDFSTEYASTTARLKVNEN